MVRTKVKQMCISVVGVKMWNPLTAEMFYSLRRGFSGEYGSYIKACCDEI